MLDGSCQANVVQIRTAGRGITRRQVSQQDQQACQAADPIIRTTRLNRLGGNRELLPAVLALQLEIVLEGFLRALVSVEWWLGPIQFAPYIRAVDHLFPKKGG